MYLNEKELDDIPEDTGLTLTWDVFKLYLAFIVFFSFSCLTLTWDVFKSQYNTNSNFIFNCLTLTWDVFKSHIANRHYV